MMMMQRTNTLSRAAVALLLLSSPAWAKKQPNILFFLTDDQDVHMGGVDHMPFLQKHIIEEGVTFSQHFCTVALCCPSRATLWTGRQAHNHNVTNVAPPHGGYPKIASQGINDDYLPLWMQDAGYNTYYAGKLWNFHGVDTYDDPYARGFNHSDFLLDPYTYRYWDTMMSHDNGPPVSYAGQYSTDVVADKAMALLEKALASSSPSAGDGGGGRPWFLTVAPTAPHSNWVLDTKTNTTYLSTPQSAYRHEHLFHDLVIPRDAPSFNAPASGAASWVGSLPQLNASVLAYNDHYQRQRLRALQAVDEMVDALVRRVADAGQLADTYVVYSTDNGYHISQHAMHPGKECGFDTDIRVPMYVRGPGLPRGGEWAGVTTHTDVAPTVLGLAGVDVGAWAEGQEGRKPFDGEAMPLLQMARAAAESAGGEEEGLTLEEEQEGRRSEHASIEYWGWGAPEGHYGFRSDHHFEAGPMEGRYMNNTYRGLRMRSNPPDSEGFSLYYSVWCTGEKELYDLRKDPGQTINLLGSSSERAVSLLREFRVAGRPVEPVLDRLDALVMVLKDCVGRTCSRPWEELHPSDRGVRSLEKALWEGFDRFYKDQPKMFFESCEEAYIKEKESNEPVNRHGFESVDGDNEDEGSRKKMWWEQGNQWILAT